MTSAPQGKTLLSFVVVVLAALQSSCIAVGYSNRGGWFVWPGSLGVLLIILLLYFVLRRR